MTQTIEQQSAETILQDRRRKVRIGENEYTINDPSTATIIMASALVSEIPDMRREAKADGTFIMQTVLDKAKDARNIGKLLALLILGAKRVKEHRMVPVYPNVAINPFFHPVRWWKTAQVRQVEEIEALTDEILENMTPDEIAKELSPCLLDQDIAGFFYLSTSLKLRANVLKPTKTEVDSKTTQSGPSY